MTWRKKAKKGVAIAAVENVKDGFVIGLGSGTTVAYVFQELGRRIREERLNVLGVPTSYQAFHLAVENKIATTTLEEHPRLDVTIDGADQVDQRLDMIKGMGGALTREKIVACASRKNVIVIDETKWVTRLGANHPVPVEVMPFALSLVTTKMNELGGEASLIMAQKKVGPIVTDNGNFILNVDFGLIDSPSKLDRTLQSIPGVVETGLFIGMADVVYVGSRETVHKFERS
ncbi:MAG: ribose 5-phosphate isomerase A [Candidatus Bathyarchaeota archaeon]|nr:MAG: ribose 5-phosphate isomerase A [Candidatus Bathyarchaeota archaeon]